MSNYKNITARWDRGTLSETIISRQFDDAATLVAFAGVPTGDDDEDAVYHLIVWMATEEGGEPHEQAPILLDAPEWLISNFYTQFTQVIRFQLCIQTEGGAYEAHSPIFSGRIARSLRHDGTTDDINTSILFDPYKKYVDEKAMAAGAVVIDTALDANSTNPVQNKIVAGAITGLNGRLDQYEDVFTGDVDESIKNWLDEHPEATTTVQDGSLTEAKFADALKLKTVKDYVTPEMYGAVGDGVTDDTTAINSAIASNRNVKFMNGKTYLISPLSFQSLENVVLFGENAILKIDNSSNQHNNTGIITLSRCKNVILKGLTFTTTALATNDENTDVTNLFASGMFGVYLQNCERITVRDCDVSLVKDGISTENCADINILNNYIYNCGQEPIAIRHTTNCLVDGNNCFWHLGDGILIKAYTSDAFWGITITDNFLHDGKIGEITDIQDNTYNNLGGGVTCNAETITSGYTTKGLVVANNHFIDVHYGIKIGNISNAVVANNIVKQGLIDGAYNMDCIGLETHPINNLSSTTLRNVLFVNNICSGGYRLFFAKASASVTLENIVFQSNIGFGGDSVVTEYGMECSDCIVKDNLIYNTKYLGYFTNCVVDGNTFKYSTLQDYTEPRNAGIRTFKAIDFKNNTLIDTTVYFFSDEGNICNNNVITSNTTSPYIVAIDTSSGSITMFGNLLNYKKIRASAVKFGRNPYNVSSDFFRTFWLDDSRNSYISRNYNTFMVVINATSATDGTIGTITEPYFIPPESIQVICFIDGSGIARVSAGTSGVVAVRASSTGSFAGAVVGNACHVVRSIS